MMTMELTDNAKATILLCTNLALTDQTVKPFTAIQWYELGVKIYKSELHFPEKLFGQSENDLVTKLGISQDEAGRIVTLLSRAINLSFALDQLDKNDIHLVTKSDSSYPQRIVEVLGNRNAPPVLYYSGDLSIANGSVISIVGSRNIDQPGNVCAGVIAQRAAENDIVVCSGGARGVDSIARTRALQANGKCIEFVADTMLRKLQTAEYYKPIIKKKLLVLSAVSPSAPFNVANAMNRNKFVYALSQQTFVIASEANKGGTWTGATECLRQKWVPVSVWDESRYKGNKLLAGKGARLFSDYNTVSLMPEQVVVQEGETEIMADLFHGVDNITDDTSVSTVSSVGIVAPEKSISTEKNDSGAVEVDGYSEANNEGHFDGSKMNVYNAVLPLILDYYESEHTIDDGAEFLNVLRTQLSEWIKMAITDGFMEKMTKPIRYKAVKKFKINNNL